MYSAGRVPKMLCLAQYRAALLCYMGMWFVCLTLSLKSDPLAERCGVEEDGEGGGGGGRVTQQCQLSGEEEQLVYKMSH